MEKKRVKYLVILKPPDWVTCETVFMPLPPGSATPTKN